MSSSDNTMNRAPDNGVVPEDILPLEQQLIAPVIEEAPSAAEAVSVPPTEGSRHNMLRSAFHLAKQAVKHAVIAVEIAPVTNEGIRFGSLFAVQAYSHNPLLGAAVLGGTTFAIEGGAAVAASKAVAGEEHNLILDPIKGLTNKAINKFVGEDSHIPIVSEAGIAMTAGTPVLMAAKQTREPERTVEQVRRHGLTTAGWMTGVFAVEGALWSEGIDNYTNPMAVGPALIATGALLAFPGYVKRRREAKHEHEHETEPKPFSGEAVGITTGGVLTPEALQRSAAAYDGLRNDDDEGIKVGLYGEDLEAALENPKSVLVKYQNESGEAVHMPLLVPIEDLSWYNVDLFKKTYGEDAKFYYFTHPHVPEGENSRLLIVGALEEELEEGAIIFTDRYLGRDSSGGSEYVIDRLQNDFVMDKLGTGDRERGAEIYVGPVEFEGVHEVKEAEDMYTVYRKAVEAGEIVDDPMNGVSVIDVIVGEDAERIWEVYENPFEDLGEEHPMHAGFTKEELMDILSDPGETKIVNRVDGKISTLCFFVSDFDRSPWFNKGYYQRNYPEYYNTNNILMFPGIVTDENMRGNDYSMNVIDLATKLMAKRGSNLLVTFECTETSATYIPKIVEAAIGNSGVGKITGLDQPVSTMDYVAFRKS